MKKNFSLTTIILTILIITIASANPVYADDDGKSSENYSVTIMNDSNIIFYKYYVYFLSKVSNIYENQHEFNTYSDYIPYDTVEFSNSITFNVNAEFPDSVLEKDLQPEFKIPSTNPLIQSIVDYELPVDRFDDMTELYVIHLINYIQEHVKYNAYSKNRNQGALPALISGEGVCEDFSDLLVAFCRSANIPSRKIIGLVVDKTTHKVGFHAWTAIYFDNCWHEMDPLVYRGDLCYNWDYYYLGDTGDIIGKSFSNTPFRDNYYSIGFWNITE